MSAMPFKKVLLAGNRVAFVLGGVLGLVLAVVSLVREQPLQRGVVLVGLFGSLALVSEVTQRAHARVSLLSGIGADAFGSLVLLLPNAAAAMPGLGEWAGRVIGAAFLFILPAILQVRAGPGDSRPKVG